MRCLSSWTVRSPVGDCFTRVKRFGERTESKVRLVVSLTLPPHERHRKSSTAMQHAARSAGRRRGPEDSTDDALFGIVRSHQASDAL
jgi:hypothetical protein